MLRTPLTYSTEPASNGMIPIDDADNITIAWLDPEDVELAEMICQSCNGRANLVALVKQAHVFLETHVADYGTLDEYIQRRNRMIDRLKEGGEYEDMIDRLFNQ